MMQYVWVVILLSCAEYSVTELSDGFVVPSVHCLDVILNILTGKK